MWTAVLGTAAQLGSNYLSGRAKRKAAKKQLKMMKKALEEYKAGSYDAYGNRLHGNSDGTWSYNLTDSAKNARLGATKAMNALGNYQYKTGRQLANQNMVANILANNKIAQSNQSAAMKQALRTGSNLGAISNAYSKQNVNNLRNSYLQGQFQAQNAPMYNANMVNLLSNAATSAQKPLQNIQRNLQNQVNSLNKTALSQMSNIAQASNNPYLYGQDKADLLEGVSSFLPKYSLNNDANISSQQAQMLQALLSLLQNR